MKNRPPIRLLSAVLYGLLAAILAAEIGPLLPRVWAAWVQGTLVLLGLLLGFLAAPLLVVKPLRWAAEAGRRLPAGSLAAGLLGLTGGLFLAFLLSAPLASLPGAPGHYGPLAASLVLSALGVAIFVGWEQELAHAGRRLFPRLAALDSTNGHVQNASREILLDTSAIIDGRIADISRSGFLQGTLVVPRFVLEELRHIADSTDAQRRTRGRRGLEMLNRLQQESATPVQVLDLEIEGGEVDDKLLLLAFRLHAPIVTTDFNLNRVAELQGIRILNVNELANALRPPVLPGEELGVHVQQEGKEPNQGLAFLEDGTMVVIEGGRRFIGQDLEVTITRVLQTAAGRIIFSHPRDA